MPGEAAAAEKLENYYKNFTAEGDAHMRRRDWLAAVESYTKVRHRRITRGRQRPQLDCVGFAASFRAQLYSNGAGCLGRHPGLDTPCVYVRV